MGQAYTQQPTVAPDKAATEKLWPRPDVVRPRTPPEAGIVTPRLTKDAKPIYPSQAMKKKITGVVWMEAVVETDGRVREVRVTRSLDAEFGLDDEAVKTVKKWEFTPGKKDGSVVPMLIEVEMSFTLRK